MTDTGWVKLYRSLAKWEWHTDPNTLSLWVHILISVNHEPKKWKGREIEAGQRGVSIAHLAKECGLTIRQTRTALEHLKSTGEVTCETTNKYTVITVVKWADFQANSQEATSNVTTKLTNKTKTTDKQNENKTTTTKEYKEDKNERNKEDNKYLTILCLFNETCPSFAQVKKLSEDRKKAISARLKKYTIEDFKTLFEKAEASDFLKGNNNRNWSANFDWLIKDRNMPKVLEGNYDNREQKINNGEWSFLDFVED